MFLSFKYPITTVILLGIILSGFTLAFAQDPNTIACSDLIDNDGDGLVDFPADPGCSSSTDNDEFNAAGVQISGDPIVWYKNIVTFDGPATNESSTDNPFRSYRLNVTFNHPVSGQTVVVPGHYAADG